MGERGVGWGEKKKGGAVFLRPFFFFPLSTQHGHQPEQALKRRTPGVCKSGDANPRALRLMLQKDKKSLFNLLNPLFVSRFFLSFLFSFSLFTKKKRTMATKKTLTHRSWPRAARRPHPLGARRARSRRVLVEGVWLWDKNESPGGTGTYKKLFGSLGLARRVCVCV